MNEIKNESFNCEKRVKTSESEEKFEWVSFNFC